MPTRVLLCDTPDGLAQLQYALLKSGASLEIEIATDGLRAVEVAARTQPALVVTEIGLEGLNGADLIRRLLAIVPETSVICWTNVPSPLVSAQMLHAGASAFLVKEDGPEAVLRAMRAVLDGNVALSHRVGSQIAARLVGEVTQRRELEVALGDVSERLEALTSAKADFLANVSHELRTPITVAKGIAYVLKNRGIPRDEQQRFLDQLDSSLEKLMVLVEEMLTVAELDRGTLTLKLTEVDIAPVLRHVAEEVGRQHPLVPILVELADRLQGAADPVRIAEALRQLLDNACRYSPEGAEVLLKGRATSEGIVVSVTDHGEGLSRDVATQAFREPFTAGEEILRKERAGAGVGLHLARQIVVQHGGIMWADPLPAGGTRVAFMIPAHRGETLTKPPEMFEEPIPPPGPVPRQEIGNVVPFTQRTSTASSS